MKTTLACDLLVVGAGPAGSAAALAAARRGLHVCVVDRRRVIGVPVQCGEYIPALLLGQLNLDKTFIAQSVNRMKTFLPGEPVQSTPAPGFIIHRERFDQAMMRAACYAGAKLMPATRARQRIDARTVLLERKNGPDCLVRARIIIGADGPRSTVGAWVGHVNRHLLWGMQKTLPLTQPMDWTEVHFDPEIFGGYGWLFPKKSTANVGIGLRLGAQKPSRVRGIMDRFIGRLRADGKVTGEPVRPVAGWIPAEPVRSAVFGNVALAGDAAGQTHPITGAGISSAVICGNMAGTWAARAVEKGAVGLLRHYDEQWQDFFQETLDHGFQRRRIMESGWPDFTSTIKRCWIAFHDYHA